MRVVIVPNTLAEATEGTVRRWLAAGGAENEDCEGTPTIVLTTPPGFARTVPNEDCVVTDAGEMYCVPPPVRIVVTAPKADWDVMEAGLAMMLVFMTGAPKAD
jgi:hypothetical protein